VVETDFSYAKLVMILGYFIVSTTPNEYHSNLSTGGTSYWCQTHEEEEEEEEEEADDDDDDDEDDDDEPLVLSNAIQKYEKYSFLLTSVVLSKYVFLS